MKRLMLIVMTFGLIAAGCVPYPGSTRFPYGASLDRHNFVSTWDMPLSIAVIDTITDEQLLLIHIPVHKMLVIDFEHEHDNVPARTSALPAEKVSWELVEPGTLFDADLENKMDLPGRPVKLKVIRRDSPDVPDDVSAAPVQAPGVEAMPTPDAAPSRGPATMEQPESMVPPRRIPAVEVGDGNHTMDSRPDEPMMSTPGKPVAPAAEPDRGPEPEPEAEPEPEVELGEDLEDVLGATDIK